MQPLDIALVVALVVAAMATVMSSNLLRSVIGLAIASAVLAVIIFRLGSPIAAVIELSVCAGLIPAIFISAVSMTARISREEATARWRNQLRRIWILPAILVAATLAMIAYVDVSAAVSFAIPTGSARDVREVLWNFRQIDLLGQVAVLLAGAFTVVILVKEVKEAKA